ncbi:hypothetical protein [Micromonospora zamorensis]|uniref:Uncharacterized protein n=1 Tax=Micromonospora zamorensis TaxID=709883 RepID=A0ABZ1PMS3_9ACTN
MPGLFVRRGPAGQHLDDLSDLISRGPPSARSSAPIRLAVGAWNATTLGGPSGSVVAASSMVGSSTERARLRRPRHSLSRILTPGPALIPPRLVT